MEILQWVRMRGDVLKTTRWVIKEYEEAIRLNPGWTYTGTRGARCIADEGREKILNAIIDARYSFPPDELRKSALKDRMKTSFEYSRKADATMPGLYRLVGCILALEAEFNHLSDKNRSKFCLLIWNELRKYDHTIICDNFKATGGGHWYMPGHLDRF